MPYWTQQLGRRLKVSLVSTLGYWIIRIIGKSLRWQAVHWDALESVHKRGKRLILAFWHGRIFTASYYFRRRGIVVMTSRNRDGEFIARVIQRLGYEAARGSSSRGSLGAALEALRALKNGKDIGFTMDGPRGPRYVAKPGAAFMAWKSGNPVVPFHVAAEKKWTLRSWDHFQIPRPFSRALVLIGDPIYIDPATRKEEIAAYEARIQHELDALRDRGDRWWGQEPD